MDTLIPNMCDPSTHPPTCLPRISLSHVLPSHPRTSRTPAPSPLLFPRSDIIHAFLTHAVHAGDAFQGGLILAGSQESNAAELPPDVMVRYIEKCPAPIVRAPGSTYDIIKKVEGYTAKLNLEDKARTLAVVDHYSSHIPIEELLEAL